MRVPAFFSEYAEYAAMQRAIRTRAESRDLAPIEWECGEWIRRSALEKKKREKAL